MVNLTINIYMISLYFTNIAGHNYDTKKDNP